VAPFRAAAVALRWLLSAGDGPKVAAVAAGGRWRDGLLDGEGIVVNWKRFQLVS
jgi:hypothetical protein